MLKRIFLLVLSVFTMIIFLATKSPALEDQPRSGIVEHLPAPGVPVEGTGVEAVGSNVNVTQNSRPQNETSITADPDNPKNLLAGTNDYRYGDTDAGFAYSFDGGTTWVSDTLAGVEPLSGKYDAQGAPTIAPYRKGVFYFAFIDFSRTTEENRLAVAKTLDGGITWTQLGVIIDHEGTGNFDFEDKAYIAVDNTGSLFDGNVYVSWTRFPVAASTRILFTRSIDGGATFSAPVQISDSTFGYQGSVPVVGPNGEIYVAWLHSGRIEIDKSTDGGLTWGNDVLVDIINNIPNPLPGALFRTNSLPTIAVDTGGRSYNDGNVYVAWADSLGVGQGPDILFSRSTDSGQTWSAPIRVSDDTNSEYQWFPWMSVSPDGTISLVFFDRRDAPGSARYHTYMAQSRDGGLSFEPNVRVSDQISDAAYDGFGGAFIGDYNGIVSTSNASHPYWTDTRATNANAEGYTAAIATDDPVPDIKANGSDGSVIINKGDFLSVAIMLDAGNLAGTPVDWYACADSPFGRYHYNYQDDNWTPDCAPAHASTPLFDISTFEVLNSDDFLPSILPLGDYIFCFGLDTGVAYFDCVDVTIQ